ncbi:MAG: hypothetical protein A2W25_14730 [candidate division Zixibacteria bacterium RBG_16_53_22]|nr:MAG: hypothetical protein A2W25_14730 [candidate division Zixibacteria bacterium RBG_16_53_22]
MTIRSKLIFSYAVMLAVVLAIGTASVWSILRWSRAAKELSQTYSRVLLAERLRSNMVRQINYGREFIYGDSTGKGDFWSAEEITAQLLKELKNDAANENELDHIRGLEETQYELVWVMRGFFDRGAPPDDQDEREAARNRLREISDEVSDDIAAIIQYYRSMENRNIAGGNRAGTIAMTVIASAAVLAVLQLIAIIYLLQRWLAYPITLVNRATREISRGNLDSQVSIESSDEWGQLALAINEMSKALKNSQQKLLFQERLAALGEIGSYTAHNLRNPLAGIRAAAQVALGEPAGAHPETSDALNEIIRAVDRMDLWIIRFLSYAKPLNLEIDRHDLNQIASQVGTMARRPYAGKVELRLRLANEPLEAEVDGVLFEQAVHVIAANAFEAMDGNGIVEIETRRHAGHDSEPWGVIAVTDNGVGIPANIQQKLFKPFISSKESGTGLGLAQAKKIVDLHGGSIEIESLSPGTKVVIMVPLKRSGTETSGK